MPDPQKPTCLDASRSMLVANPPAEVDIAQQWRLCNAEGATKNGCEGEAGTCNNKEESGLRQRRTRQDDAGEGKG
eukprot:12938699-Prorocentrum_lima.AAC.1